MFKKSAAFLICVFMFSIFHISEQAYSYPNIPAGTSQAREYNGILIKLGNRKTNLLARKTDILASQSAITTLDSSWKSNEDAIKAGNSATVSAALGTFVSTVAVIPTVGTSTLATASSAGSAFLSAYNTYSTSAETGNKTLNRNSFKVGFEKAFSGYGAAVAWQKSEHESYTRIYVNEYLKMQAEHSGGLYTYVGSQQSGPHTKLALYSLIHGTSITENGSQLVIGAYVENPSSKKESGYYHGSAGGPDHVMSTHLHWDQADITPLAANKKCKGTNCNDMFATYYEAFSTHRQKCGKEETQSISDLLAILSIGDTTGLAWRQTRAILAKRSVEDGCGDDWYSCDSDHATQEASHRVRTCKIEIPQSSGGTKTCGDSFRRCMEHKKDHDESTILNRKTVHSDTPDSTTTETTQNEFQQPTPTPAPTPSYHTCGVHETSVSGTHSAAGCGVSGHYVCDGSDHSLQASCTVTNASGQSCTVTSFYACQSHTHVYPAPPAISCGRSGCTETVSSSTAHQVTCSAGHQYWSCGQYATWHANHHRTRTCRFGKCGQSWQRCSRPSSAPTPMCADPTRSGQRCWAQS
ncbi:MAG: hypothetical protein OXI67_09860 [Candidatus Poribacteria bacterium]|nr:hypothetical protein [Candidatus Poribacteria bacterium]